MWSAGLLVFDLYKITLLSNALPTIIALVLVFDLYKITLLSNYSGTWTAYDRVFDLYKITLLSNLKFRGITALQPAESSDEVKNARQNSHKSFVIHTLTSKITENLNLCFVLQRSLMFNDSNSATQ